MEQAKLWWESLGDNFLMRMIIQGELCTKYYTFMRRTSSLKDNEIIHIYEQECFVD